LTIAGLFFCSYETAPKASYYRAPVRRQLTGADKTTPLASNGALSCFPEFAICLTLTGAKNDAGAGQEGS
jgi:hypothetical protein